MKVAIITIHFGVNYGSALQAYALTNYLEERGHEVTLINYIPERYSYHSRYASIIQHNGIVKGVVKIVAGMPSRLIYDNIFNSFLNKYTNISGAISSNEELKNQFGDFDVLIAGSDQIWNSDYNGGVNEAYFLTFGNEKSLKIAYAASCGKMDFSADELEHMRKLVVSLNRVTVRESTMLPIMHNIGVKNAIQVLDPVMLVGDRIWEKLLMNKDNKFAMPYLFIYLLDGDIGATVDIACKIAKKNNLKTVMISFGHVWSRDSRVDQYLIHQNPNDFVNLIKNASFVVTNSFHGMAFSITFNKQFLAFKRNAYNSRLDSLASCFGLEDYLVLPSEVDDSYLSNLGKLKYDKINGKINEMRKISSEVLNFE